MIHNQTIFRFLMIYFEQERLWHHHVPELYFKITDSTISGEVKF